MAGELTQAMQVMPNMQANFGTGMATGMQAGHQMDVANNLLDLGTQGAQMSNDAQSMNLQQQYANQPLLNTQRQVAQGTAQDALAQQSEGIPQELVRSAATTKLSNDQATQLSNNDKKKLAIGDFATQVDSSIKDSGGSSIPLQMQQEVRSRWKQMTGQDLPTDPTEARELIGKYADWNANTGAKLADRAKFASAQEVAKINAQGKLDVANVNKAKSNEAIALRAQVAAKDPKKLEEAITQYQLKKSRGESTTEAEDTINSQNVAMFEYGKAQAAAAKIGNITTGTVPAPDAAVDSMIKGTPKAAPTAGKYTPDQETKIQTLMKTNPGHSRDEIIQGMKAKGFL